MAQNLKDFLEHFELAYMDVGEGREQKRKLHRMSDTLSFKITPKVLYLQYHSRFRYDSTD